MFVLLRRTLAVRSAIIATICALYVALSTRAASAGIITKTTCPVTIGPASGGLPWEGPLCTLVASLTGPVALAISIAAIFAAGAALVFGEEMSGFVRRALTIVVAVAFLIGGSSIVNTLFAATL